MSRAATASQAAAVSLPPGAALRGKMFVNPLFDYMLIGGGFSLVVSAALIARGGASIVSTGLIPYIVFVSTMAHFASSTVRLYSKPGAFRSLPFLTMGLPLVSLVVLLVAIRFAGQLGPHMQSLYLTWSPYHYAAQAYGLAVMYSYRSGCALSPTNKKLLWWVAMSPFFYAFLFSSSSGARWLLPDAWFANAGLVQPMAALQWVLRIVVFSSPLVFLVRVWQSDRSWFPVIGVVLLFSNGIWWLVLSPLDAFVWATIFHGIQYMAIVIIFHMREQMLQPQNTRGPVFHAVKFYGLSLVLGYGLFRVLPLAFTTVGFDLVETFFLVTAAINIHHFVVDAFIWRLKPTDGNRAIVREGSPVAA